MKWLSWEWQYISQTKRDRSNLTDDLIQLFSPACTFLNLRNLWANSNIKIRSKHSLSSPRGGPQIATLNPLKLCRAQIENHWSDLAIIFQMAKASIMRINVYARAGGLMCWGAWPRSWVWCSQLLPALNTSCLLPEVGLFAAGCG